MLIVLLDCSSSMNEPLEGDVPPAGADVRKIDLARQVLNEHLARAHPQEPVIVLGFAGSAVELARGHSIHDLQSRIDAARLGTGTDIPAALAAATSAVRSEPADGSCTVVVITDGLLDGRPDEDLDAAVAELSPLVAYVKVSLIGASERGIKIAIRISRNAPVVLHPAMASPVPKAGLPGVGSSPLLLGTSRPGGVSPRGPSGFGAPAAKQMGMAMRMRRMPAGVAPKISSEGETQKTREVDALALDDLERDAEYQRRTPEDRNLRSGAGLGASRVRRYRRDQDDGEELDRVMAAIEPPREVERPIAALDVDADEVMAEIAPSREVKQPERPIEVKQPYEKLEAIALSHKKTVTACFVPVGRAPLAPARDVEDVAVTVAHAPGVARGVWHPLDVFVHLASLEDEVGRIVRAERGHGAARASRGARLRRGTTVRIEPRIEGAELDVEALEMRWRDDVQRAVFRIRPAAGATELRGSVDVYVKHAVLCTVPIAIAVIDAPRPAEPPVTATGRMMNMVFVSYATEERPVVERVTRTYRELGITVLMDKDFLHAGDTTGEVLRNQIERADVFQLFWSTRSSQKPWVEREWRHALTLTGPAGRKGARFIRPLVWERRPPAWPPELAALQFSRLELAWLARAGGHLGMLAVMCLAAAMGFAAVVAIVFALAAVR